MASVTPMMQQYLNLKAKHQDCILFFRLGDFYEMFFDDAKTASRELELTLTGKDCGLEERAPMCGVPSHAVNTYVEKLIARGFKVAICEQLQDARRAFTAMMDNVNRILRLVITGETGDEDTGSGCSGNCSGCAGCH